MHDIKKNFSDYYKQNKENVNYKNIDTLSNFISPEGKILPARRTGLSSKNQRKVTKAIKRARLIGLLPFKNLDI